MFGLDQGREDLGDWRRLRLPDIRCLPTRWCRADRRPAPRRRAAGWSCSDFGIAEVLRPSCSVDEAVAKAPRVAAREAPRSPTVSVNCGSSQRSPVHRAAARFVREDECGAQLGRHGSRGEHVGDVDRRHQSAGRDHRHARAADPRRTDQLAQRLGPPGRPPGSSAPRCPPAAGPWTATRVDAAGNGPLGFGQGGDGADGGDAGAVQPARTPPPSGSPNVNDTTSGFRSITTSSFSAHWSSSKRGSPSRAAVPLRLRSPNAFAYR